MIERYEPAAHDVSRFDCGEAALSRWLRHSAGQSQRRDAARTFVVAEHGRVIGYYTTVVGELDHTQASPAVRRGMSRHFPILTAVVARLAVDVDFHGRETEPGCCETCSRG